VPRQLDKLEKVAQKSHLSKEFFGFSNYFFKRSLPMGSMNKVILIGRLGKDPEDRVTNGGTRVSNFSLATDHVRTGNGNGAAFEKITEWHRIVAFGKSAEVCNQYLRKGRQICVEGSLQTRSWEKPPGEKHYATEVIASRITFLDSKGKEEITNDLAAGDPEF
jgi:single-strand DNA-binding protein